MFLAYLKVRKDPQQMSTVYCNNKRECLASVKSKFNSPICSDTQRQPSCLCRVKCNYALEGTLVFGLLFFQQEENEREDIMMYLPYDQLNNDAI